MLADPYDSQPATALSPEVFISYARRDYEQVRTITDQFAELGVSVWLDQQAIDGGGNFALAIARGIKRSRVFVLMCSDAALRSRNVNQEILLAWKYERPYLPLLLEQVSFPEQVEYFLEGVQWIEVLDWPTTDWLPRVQRSLALAGVESGLSSQSSAPISPPSLPQDQRTVQPCQTRGDLAGLRALASFNDRVWPLPVDRIPPNRGPRTTFRGLGAPQKDIEREYKLGSHLGLAIDVERPGHLLVIDEGHDGTIYCLCPSWFAPNTQVESGVNYLPNGDAHYRSFEVSGEPGREQLLAIISEKPLELDWMPADPQSPARVLSSRDIELLLSKLRQLDPATWDAYATYFQVVL